MCCIHVGMGKTGTTSIQHFSKNSSGRAIFSLSFMRLAGRRASLLALNKLKSQKWAQLIDEICSQEIIDDSSKSHISYLLKTCFLRCRFLKEVEMLDKRIAHKIIIGLDLFRAML